MYIGYTFNVLLHNHKFDNVYSHNNEQLQIYHGDIIMCMCLIAIHFIALQECNHNTNFKQFLWCHVPYYSPLYHTGGQCSYSDAPTPSSRSHSLCSAVDLVLQCRLDSAYSPVQ